MHPPPYPHTRTRAPTTNAPCSAKDSKAAHAALAQRVAELELQLARGPASPAASPAKAGGDVGPPSSPAHLEVMALQVSLATLEAENKELLTRLEERVDADQESAGRVAEEIGVLNRELAAAKDTAAAVAKAHAAEVARLRSEAEAARVSGSVLVRSADAETRGKDARIAQLESQLSLALSAAQRDVDAKEAAMRQLADQLEVSAEEVRAAEARCRSVAIAAEHAQAATAARVEELEAALEDQRTALEADLKQMRVALEVANNAAAQQRAGAGGVAPEDRIQELETTLFTTAAALRAERRYNAWVWDVGCGMWDVGCGMWDVGCGMWDVGCGMWDVGCGVWGVICACASLLDSVTVCGSTALASGIRSPLAVFVFVFVDNSWVGCAACAVLRPCRFWQRNRDASAAVGRCLRALGEVGGVPPSIRPLPTFCAGKDC